MRILLRHVRTGYYYNGRRTWVAPKEDAGYVRSLEQALQVIIKERLEGMSLVILHEKTGTEQILDLSSENSDTTIMPASEVIDFASK
jgi:hypothetical protein